MLNQPGWLFLDRDQVESFRRLVISSEGEDTVDQLGFGSLTKEISDILFPWCSTLTTRGRYFIFSTAILQIAIERTVQSLKGKTHEDSLSRAELRDLVRRFQKEVQRLETVVAVSLFALYYSTRELGIFGKRNLDQRSDRQLIKVLQKDLLSASNRYPNAIYRGGLTELGLFSQQSSSNSWAIQLALNREDAFDAEWMNASQFARHEIEKLERFWTAGGGTSLTFAQACSDFSHTSIAKQFRGFELQAVEKRHIADRILRSTPYLAPLKSGKNSLIPSKGNLDLGALSKLVAEDWRIRLAAANDVNVLISPFQQMYLQIGKRQEARLKSLVYPIDEIRRAYRALGKVTCFGQLGQALVVTEPWIRILERTSGKVNEELILHLKDRAERIVGARSKTPPHLLTTKQQEAENKNDVTSELDVDPAEGGFRLGRATMILRDVFGAARAK